MNILHASHGGKFVAISTDEIVSADDIYKAVHYLDYEPNPSWSGKNREIAKMEILLGFFAGLRTMEGLGAIRRHFPGGEFLPFLVLHRMNAT
jgi:hypothetical protein